MAFVALVPTIYYNVKQYGAAGDGSTDDTTAINNAISAASSGGIVFFSPGTYRVSSPLAINHNYVRFQGVGVGSIIQPSASFSGANIINVTSSFTGVKGVAIEGISGTYSSNPAADAIQITGVTHVNIEDIYFQAINGWQIQSTATSGTANYNIHFTECRGYQCKSGFHMQGVSGSGYASVHVLLNCYATQVQSGDCYFIEDVQDIQATNIFGEQGAGSGAAIHIKGACSSVYFSNVDLGPYPGPSTGDVILIETSSNGTPNQIGIFGGVAEGGTSGIHITNGTNMSFHDLQIFNNGTYGVNLAGGDSTIFQGCVFNGNGSAGSSGRYDMQIAGNHTIVDGCYFNTPQGTTAGKVNNVMNCTSGTTSVTNCQFYGTGFNSGNIFNNFPNIIRNCQGYNPLGNTSAPSITASPCTVGPFAQDYTVYISGGTVSSVKIGSTATGTTSGAFVLPAGLQLILTYSSTPTWTWFGN